MALQIELTADANPIGIDIPTVYCRVVGIRANDTEAVIIVNFHASAVARAANAHPICTREYILTQFDIIHPLPVGIKELLYTFLKTLPDFANSVDV